MSGAMTCGILSLTLLSLAQRSTLSEIVANYTVPASIAPTAEAAVKEPAILPAIVRVDDGK